MPSSFLARDLFGSGPHRFALEPLGSLVVPMFTLSDGAAGSVSLGPLELAVVVTGRLVAPTEAALWSLRDAIGALLTDPARTGTLVDGHGRSWADMSFVRFEHADRTDRGRVASLAYRARFLRFLSPLRPGGARPPGPADPGAGA